MYISGGIGPRNWKLWNLWKSRAKEKLRIVHCLWIKFVFFLQFSCYRIFLTMVFHINNNMCILLTPRYKWLTSCWPRERKNHFFLPDKAGKANIFVMSCDGIWLVFGAMNMSVYEITPLIFTLQMGNTSPSANRRTLRNEQICQKVYIVIKFFIKFIFSTKTPFILLWSSFWSSFSHNDAFFWIIILETRHYRFVSKNL